jgi:hypothetical protein
MKWVRALGAVALMIAVLAATAPVCPCTEHPAGRDHGCCAQGTALRAAGSDCCARVDAAVGAAAAVESGPALPLTDVVAALMPSAPAPRDATRRDASPFSVSPPTILRI